MTSTYDSTGVILDRVADIRTRLQTLSKAQWGESIDLSEDEYLGHMIENISVLLGEINELIQGLYDAQSVANATGVGLDNLLEIIGLTRPPDAYSTVTLTLTANGATTVPAGSQYSTAAGVVFATDEELVFAAAGSDNVTATCTIPGPNNAAIAEVTTIVTGVFAITAVTNAAAATPGSLRASNSEQKASHALAVATSGESDAASIYEALIVLTGVDAVRVYDNDTNETASDGTPAKNIHISVIGGDSDEIAEAINNTKTSGVPMYGATDVDYYDEVTAQSKTITYDVAVDVRLYLIIEGTKTVGVYPDDGDAQLTAALVDHFVDFRIGENMIFNALYAPAYSIPGLVVTDIFIEDSTPPAAQVDITATALQRLTLAEADITVTVT